MLDKIRDRVIAPASTLLEAMKAMDKAAVKILFVFDGEDFRGIFTIGDVQRAVIAGHPLSDAVRDVLDTDKIYAYSGESDASIREKMKRLRAECMPVLDSDGRLVDVLFWKDMFLGADAAPKEPLGLPVVIMAGGEGTRLRPLTNVFPKPLVPIGEKTIIEEIMDRFVAVGCTKFFISVGYKADIIEYYLSGKGYDVSFIREDKPLGTIGSISMLSGRIDTPFFVFNCDLLIDQDFTDIYQYHRSSGNEITIVTAVKDISIPYGVVRTGEGGILTDIEEKPDTTFLVNTGCYILEPSLISEVPSGEFFHITDLIDKVRARGGRVGCFPVSEKSWTDIGTFDEYLKIIRR